MLLRLSKKESILIIYKRINANPTKVVYPEYHWVISFQHFLNNCELLNIASIIIIIIIII